MAKTQSKSAGGLSRFKLIALLSALAGIALCTGLLYVQVIQSANNNHHDESANQQAQAVAALLDARYSDLRSILRQQSTSSIVMNAMASKGPESKAQRSAAAAKVAGNLPMAVRVDLIPTGTAKVDLKAGVPINFAALDLIRRAESTEFVGPEASAIPQDVIYTAAPVAGDSGLTGVLFVAFSADYLLNALKGLDETLGLAEVEQAIDNAPSSIVLKYGNGDHALLPIRHELQAPHWTLVFNGANTAEVTSLIDLILPIASVLVLALGGIWVAFGKLSAAAQSDSKELAEFGRKLLAGRSGPSDHFQISHFQQVATALNSKAEGKSSNESTVEAATPANKKTTEPQAPPQAINETERAASGATAALLAAGAATAGAAAQASSESDDFLDLGDDDSDSSASGNPTSSFLQANLPHVESEQLNVVPSIEDAEEDTEEDDNFGIEQDENAESGDRASEAPPTSPNVEFDPEIFRAYDIRGIVDTNLTREVVYWIGRAFAVQAKSQGQTKTAVGRDGRLSSPALSKELSRGLVDGGMNVIDIGQVATPMLYFATHSMNTGTGIMITGSHNPAEYNGLKMMIAGETLAEEQIKALHQLLTSAPFEPAESQGQLEAIVIDPEYMDRILDDVAVAKSLKIVVDCGNGVAGGIAPLILQELGCDVIPLYCEVDGTFPNHHPDPADPRNMTDLITVVKAESADLGIAFDGDGDRIGLVSNTGKIIWPDKLMMLFARDIVARNPGADIIYDVKCSRHLNNLIAESGGRPIMWKTGHSHIKAKLKETGALLAGEFSGHIAFGERWYGFDDAIYTAARLLEIVGSDSSTVAELFDQFPDTQSTPEIQIKTSENAKFEIIKKLAATADFGEGTVTSIDGVRVDYADGWGLVRASNTSPKLTLRFEADTVEALEKVQNKFRTELAKVHSSLKF